MIHRLGPAAVRVNACVRVALERNTQSCCVLKSSIMRAASVAAVQHPHSIQIRMQGPGAKKMTRKKEGEMSVAFRGEEQKGWVVSSSECSESVWHVLSRQGRGRRKRQKGKDVESEVCSCLPPSLPTSSFFATCFVQPRPVSTSKPWRVIVTVDYLLLRRL